MTLKRKLKREIRISKRSKPDLLISGGQSNEKHT
jgi:hypothetical protein